MIKVEHCGDFRVNGYYGSDSDLVTQAIVGCAAAGQHVMTIEVSAALLVDFTRQYEQVWKAPLGDLRGWCVNGAFVRSTLQDRGVIRMYDDKGELLAELTGWDTIAFPIWERGGVAS